MPKPGDYTGPGFTICSKAKRTNADLGKPYLTPSPYLPREIYAMYYEMLDSINASPDPGNGRLGAGWRAVVAARAMTGMFGGVASGRGADRTGGARSCRLLARGVNDAGYAVARTADAADRRATAPCVIIVPLLWQSRTVAAAARRGFAPRPEGSTASSPRLRVPAPARPPPRRRRGT